MKSGSMKHYGTCVNANSGYYRNNTWSASNTVATAQNKSQSRLNYLIHLKNGANLNGQNNRKKNYENDQDQKDMYIHTNKGIEIVRLKNYVGKEEEKVDKSKYERVLYIKDRIESLVKRSEQPVSTLLENERKKEKERDGDDRNLFYVNEANEIRDNQSIDTDGKEILIPTASSRIPNDIMEKKEKKNESLWDEAPKKNANNPCKWECKQILKKKTLKVAVMNKEISKHSHRTWINRKNHNHNGNHLNHTNNESSCQENGNHRSKNEESICTNAGSNCDETTSSEQYEDTGAWELKRRLLLKKVNMSNIVKRIRSVIHYDYEETTPKIIEEVNVIHREKKGDKEDSLVSSDSVKSEFIDDTDDNTENVESMDKSELNRNAFVEKLEKLRIKLLNDRKVTCKDNFIGNDMKNNFQSDDQRNECMKNHEETNEMNFDKSGLKEPVSAFQESNKKMTKKKIETQNSNSEVIKENFNLNEEKEKDPNLEILLNFIKEDKQTNAANAYDSLGEEKIPRIYRNEEESNVMKPSKANSSYVTETIEHRTGTLLHRERERNKITEFEDNYGVSDRVNFPCIKENILTLNNTANYRDCTSSINVPLEKYNKKGNFSEEGSSESEEIGSKVVDAKNDSSVNINEKAKTIKQQSEVCSSKKTNSSRNNKKTKKRNKQQKKKNNKKKRFCHINNVHIHNINIYINNDDKNKGVTVHMDSINKNGYDEETKSGHNKNKEEKNKSNNAAKNIVVEFSENEQVGSVYSYLSELDNKV